MKKQTIEIEASLVRKLEALAIEANGLQKMLGFCLSTTDYQIPEDKINKIKEDLTVKLNEYDKAREDVTKYLENKLNTENEAVLNWEVVYETCVASVNMVEKDECYDGGCVNCVGE